MTNPIVDPAIARFAAEVKEFFDNTLDRYAEQDARFLDHSPLSMQITTVDGIAARFWEEGIEFYPGEK